MLVRRCVSLCSRVVYRGGGGGGGRGAWRSPAGHKEVKYADITCSAGPPKRLSHSEVGDLCKAESVQRYLQQLVEEFRDTSKKLQHLYLSESDRKVLMKKQAELLPLANVFERTEQALKDLEEVLSLLHSSPGEFDVLNCIMFML
ncbi:peptide chain release factor 1, mitochondrial-like [Anoplopoma fimbria]|uniref:peptide chain release factor 1, mitochondrial-like n=1 Tax=Anoplopoma fimbria TaxID=229290 RepID=UPI0023EDE24B|nr:peptide chain release factor 1, mitochondrial-like [Anoplopoma fimbria]